MAIDMSKNEEKTEISDENGQGESSEWNFITYVRKRPLQENRERKPVHRETIPNTYRGRRDNKFPSRKYNYLKNKSATVNEKVVPFSREPASTSTNIKSAQPSDNKEEGGSQFSWAARRSAQFSSKDDDQTSTSSPVKEESTINNEYPDLIKACTAFRCNIQSRNHPGPNSNKLKSEGDRVERDQERPKSFPSKRFQYSKGNMKPLQMEIKLNDDNRRGGFKNHRYGPRNLNHLNRNPAGNHKTSATVEKPASVGKVFPIVKTPSVREGTTISYSSRIASFKDLKVPEEIISKKVAIRTKEVPRVEEVSCNYGGNGFVARGAFQHEFVLSFNQFSKAVMHYSHQYNSMPIQELVPAQSIISKSPNLPSDKEFCMLFLQLYPMVTIVKQINYISSEALAVCC